MSAAPTPSLRDVQRWLKARIRPGVSPEPALTVPLNPQGGEPGEARLAVYADGYRVRLREALAEVYGAVHHVVGERAFRQLAADYAVHHPSRDYNLSLTGRHLPGFLARHPLTQRLPPLPDLARLEWAVSVAFHAPAREPIDPARLTALSLDDWQRARLVFHPSVSVVESAWPILDIWQARTAPREQIDIDVARRPQSVLVFRRGLTVRCELIEPAQAAVARGLLSGQPLGAVCAAALAPPPAARPGGSNSAFGGTAGGGVTRWFSSWMAQELIVDCEVRPL